MVVTGSMEAVTRSCKSGDSEYMKKLLLFFLFGGFVLPLPGSAMDLKQAKFTQVVNNVEVISPASQSRFAASVNDVFKMPDVLHTGPDSRAELVADDGTITRVGANTIFSFDPANRTIDLKQGSVLFHSPHGKGGGTISTGLATASVLGTTIIVTTTPNGGYKVLVLEGEAEIRFLNGLNLTLKPGQMTFVLPGGGTSPIVVFRLDDQTHGSHLVNGFNNPLPSWSKIQTEIGRQLLLLLNNKAQDTGLVVGDNATPNAVEVRMAILGQNSPFNNNASIISSGKVPTDPNPVSYPPLDPAQLESPVKPPGVAAFTEGLTFLGITGKPAAGFVGNDVDIDTGLGTPIDLSAYAGTPEKPKDFEIMALNDMRIWQPASFTGMSASDTVGLLAGGQMLIAPGSALEASTGIFGLAADTFGALNTADGTVSVPNTIEDVAFVNLAGDVDILSLSDLTLFGAVLPGSASPLAALGDVSIIAAGDVDVQSDGDLTLCAPLTQTSIGGAVDINAGGDVVLSAGLATGGNFTAFNSYIYAGDSFGGGSININAYNGSVTLNADSITAYAGNNPGAGNVTVNATSDITVNNSFLTAGTTAGTVALNSTSGQTTIENGSTVQSFYLNVNSSGGILLDGTSSSLQLSGNTMNLTASTTDSTKGITVNSVDLSGYGTVNMSAHTISLTDVAMGAGSYDNFHTFYGALAANPDTGAAAQAGYLNFINGVTYAGTLITSANQSTYVNPASGPGVYVSALP